MSLVKSSSSRIDFLDYMRVVAFLSVLLGHKFHSDIAALSVDDGVHITIRLFMSALSGITYAGAAGVVLFFFTSGYIITHVVVRENVVDFALRRCFRIYPLFWFAVLMEVILDKSVLGINYPDAIVIIQRLLLIGDFTDTPYGLAGVEWTLRIELMFYLFMGVIKATGLIDRSFLLPVVYAFAVAVLSLSGPLPNHAEWSSGYFNLYFPFLLCGSLIYISQEKMANRAVCYSVLLLIFLAFLMNTLNFKPWLKESHHAIIASGIFIISCAYRHKIRATASILLLSELTYSVYLLHSWTWKYLEMICEWVGIKFIPLRVQIVILLFLICYISYKLIELPAIRVGRKVSRMVKTRRESSIAV